MTTNKKQLREVHYYNLCKIILITCFCFFIKSNSKAQDSDFQPDFSADEVQADQQFNGSSADTADENGAEQDFTPNIQDTATAHDDKKNETQQEEAPTLTVEKLPEANDAATNQQTEKYDYLGTNDGSNNNSSYVEVETPENVNLPYKQRRGKWGMIIDFGYERLYPLNYYSTAMGDTFETFADGNTIPLYGAELGVKYNFPLGSIAAIGGYKMGSFSDTNLNITDFSVGIANFDLNFTADNLFNEPYVAPYIQGGITRTSFNADLVSGTTTFNESDSGIISYHMKAGVLFQLNWLEKRIDEDTHDQGLRDYGLQNTYLDIYYENYFAASNADTTLSGDGVGNFESAQVGAALKLEF